MGLLVNGIQIAETDYTNAITVNRSLFPPQDEQFLVGIISHMAT